MGNNPKKNPPQFSRAREYERYRTTLKAFMIVTDFDKKEVGMMTRRERSRANVWRTSEINSMTRTQGRPLH